MYIYLVHISYILSFFPPKLEEGSGGCNVGVTVDRGCLDVRLVGVLPIYTMLCVIAFLLVVETYLSHAGNV